jgi:hypothetical protein
MIKTLLFLAALLLAPGLALGADPAANLSVQVVPPSSGGGQCPGGDSGFVPAGYKCVLGSTDEFNGSSVDTSKWDISGTPGGQGPGTGLFASPANGYVVASVQPCCGGLPNGFNGSTSMGMGSKFPIPDAPMYLEFRRQVVPLSGYSLMQFWTTNCGSRFATNCNGEETDIDMGPFNGCNQNNMDPGADPFGLCSGMFVWNGGNSFGLNFTLDGPSVRTGWQTIMLQRLPDPAPNGTVRYGVNGVWLKTVTNMPDDRWLYPSRHLQPGTGSHDFFILNLFCANANGCPGNEIDWDYLRVYTPTGLPNGY